MMNSAKNRRSHYRIEIRVPVRWRFLDDEGVQLVKNGLGHTLFERDDLSTPIDDYLEQAVPNSSEEQHYRSLQYLNNKLDYLIEQVLLQSTENPGTQDEIIELSASGIKFTSQSAIPIGTYLRMNMIIPGTFQYQIDFVTKILRVEQGDKGLTIAAKIVYIDKDTQESIVKVIFQKQREEIRKKKMAPEVTDVN